MNSFAKSALLCAAVLTCANSAGAQNQNWPDTSKINKWFDDRAGKQYGVQGTKEVQKAGEIQKAGDIKIPRGLAAVTEKKADCQHRLSLCADTLFEFDKATLSADAEATLKLVGPKITALGAHPVKIEGHTDSVGTDEYNQELSQRRAERVRNWLAQNHYVPITSAIEAYGEKKPVAPNTLANGKDNPLGRQKNRRVEIVIDTCKSLESAATQPVSTEPVSTEPVSTVVPQATTDGAGAPPLQDIKVTPVP